MRSFFALAGVLAIATSGLSVPVNVAVNDHSCQAADVEVLLLIDASSSSQLQWAALGPRLADSVEAIQAAYPSAKVGLASFVDKPTVAGLTSEDWCYSLIESLAPLNSTNSISLSQRILKPDFGKGADENNAQLEALVNAAVDPSIGWSLRESSESSELSKIIVLLTDGLGHSGSWTPQSSRTGGWDAPVVCKDGVTKGGFGAQEPNASGVVVGADYQELSELIHTEVCGGASLSAKQTARKSALQTALTKSRASTAVLPFDLNELKKDSVAHCRSHEYPEYADVSHVLVKSDFKVLVLLIDAGASGEADAAPTKVVQGWTWALRDRQQGLGQIASSLKIVNDATIDKFSDLLVEGLTSFGSAGCTASARHNFAPSGADLKRQCSADCDCAENDECACCNGFKLVLRLSQEPQEIAMRIVH